MKRCTRDQPSLGKGPVLVRVTTAVMKYDSQEQLVEARVYFTYLSTPQFIIKGTQTGQEPLSRS